MTSRIKLPRALAEIAGTPTVDVKAHNVEDAIRELEAKHPSLAGRIFNEQGELRRHLMVFVDQIDIRELQGLQTLLRGNEVIYILPAVSGG